MRYKPNLSVVGDQAVLDELYKWRRGYLSTEEGLSSNNMHVQAEYYRFVEKLEINGSFNCCWGWKASLGKKSASGQFGLKRDAFGSSRRGWKLLRAHKVVYQEWIGDIPVGKMVLHSCGTRWCNNPTHLFLGTSKDLGKLKAKFEVMPKGDNHPKSKVSIDEIEQIKKLYATGVYTQEELGVVYGVTASRVSRLVNNKR